MHILTKKRMFERLCLIIARVFNQQMKSSANKIPDLDLPRYDRIKLW